MRGRPDYPLLQTMCLRSMRQAIYSPDNLVPLRAGVSRLYPFDTPIRRYPDLLTHRVIKALLEGQRYMPELEDQPIVIGRSQRDTSTPCGEKAGADPVGQRTARRRGRRAMSKPG